MDGIIYEYITKSLHSAEFLVNDLQSAHCNSDAILAYALEPLIKASADLKHRLEGLRFALEAKEKII